jgi:hypothetical protein
MTTARILRLISLLVTGSLPILCAACTEAPPPQCGPALGVLAVSWTLAGQPPGTACADGVAIEVNVVSEGCSGVTRFTNLQCQLTQFQRTGLPVGAAQVSVRAVDLDNQPLATSTRLLTIGTDAAPATEPFDLR